MKRMICLTNNFTLYRFLDIDGNILYVGKTTMNLIDRLRGHKHLPEECYSQIKEIEYVNLKSGSDMSIYEIYYINKYNPKYNTESKFADSANIKLPELQWKNFREFFHCNEELDMVESQWRTYVSDALEVFLEEEKALKNKRAKIKEELETINQVFEMLSEVKRFYQVIQMPNDTELIEQFLENRPKIPKEMTYSFMASSDAEYRKLKKAVDFIKKNGFLEIKEKSFNIIQQVNEHSKRKIEITFLEDFLSFIDIWNRQILKKNITLREELKKTNKELDTIRKRLSKIYRTKENDLDYLTKLFDLVGG